MGVAEKGFRAFKGLGSWERGEVDNIALLGPDPPPDFGEITGEILSLSLEMVVVVVLLLLMPMDKLGMNFENKEGRVFSVEVRCLSTGGRESAGKGSEEVRERSPVST